MLRAFRDAMRGRGYIEGQNVAFDVRWPKGTFSDDPDAVTHLVKGNFDVIVAWATPTVAAVRRQTSSIPIVMVSVGDPVGAGFVASLARPGGNITGVSNVTNDLSAKLVELFFEFVPAMKRVGVVSNSYNSNVAVQLRETEGAVKKFSVQTKIVEARAAAGIPSATGYARAHGARPQSLKWRPPIAQSTRLLGAAGRAKY
jgi:putative ABC transport system substrate-binding protein